MGADVLEQNSLTEAQIVYFLVAHIFCFQGLSNSTYAASLLWHSKWYNLISRKLRTRWMLMEPWLMSVFWVAYHELLALGLFFLLIEFKHPEAHHPADRGFVTGWLIAGVVAGILYPLAVTSYCNMIPAFLCSFGALGGVVVSMGLQFKYTRQEGPRHLELSDNAPWLLVFPVLWLLYCNIIAFDMAIISTRDSDYLDKCAEARKVVTDSARRTAPGNILSNAQEAALRENPERETPQPTMIANTIESAGVATGNKQHHQRGHKPKEDDFKYNRF